MAGKRKTEAAPVVEPGPSDEEVALLRAIMQDSMLRSVHPMVYCNVETALQALLRHLRRPLLAEHVRNL